MPALDLPQPTHVLITLDAAYVALNEVFPNHPLMPAIRVEYLIGQRFDGISAQVWGPTDERQKRVRDLEQNAQIFWSSFARYMQLGFQSYIGWTNQIMDVFYRYLVAHARDGKTLIKILNRLKNATVRDFRYFRLDSTADKLDDVALDDTGDPAKTVFDAIQNLLRTDTRTMKPVKDGFPLSKRLCDPYRPLLLKCLCDLIKGQEFINWLKRASELQRIPTKYRLFYSNQENTKD